MKTARLLARAWRITPAELAFRARAAAEAEAGRLAAWWRPPRWRVERLAHLLDPRLQPAREAGRCLRSDDEAGAHAVLRAHYAARKTGFPVPPAALPALRDLVLSSFPSSAAEAREQAERIARGRFDLLGYRDLDFAADAAVPAAVDWQRDPVHQRRPPAEWWSRIRFLDPAVGDHKIIWELNRHQHFVQLGRAAWLTGDLACRRTFVAHLRGWMEQNPPGIGINWASMLELAFRSLSWLWALHLFASLPGPAGDEDPWIPRLLLGLHEHLERVRRNLSRYFSPNTHLTGEALGLYVCGRALPELRDARRWADIGREVLLEQIPLQIAGDGGHCERSTHYLRYTLDFYLMALAFARATGDGAADRFEEAAARAADATRALADSEGRLPLIGDDDGGRLWAIRERDPADVRDSLALAAALLGRPDLAVGPPPEEPLWLGSAAEQGARRAKGGNAGPDPTLAETGYYVARPRPGDHLVIDAGPHGFLNGGHAHADALSLVYTVGGRPLAIDPGTFTYTMSPAWRDRLRSSPWHNTLTLDGRSQSVPEGPFHWRNAAAGALQVWSAGSSHHYFEGVHDGYLPAVHRRRVVALSCGWLVVVDTVLGPGQRHRADVHWHIDRAWDAGRDGAGRLCLRHEHGDPVQLVTPGLEPEIFVADEPSGLGWQSPIYGRLVPCTTIRLRAEGAPPLVLVSVFAADAPARAPVEVERLEPSGGGQPGDDSLGLVLRAGERVEALFFVSRAPRFPAGARPAAPVDGRLADDGRARGPRRFSWDGFSVATTARFAWLTRAPGGAPQKRAALEGNAEIESAAPRVSGAA